MTDLSHQPDRVDRYVRGELNDSETLAFEAELLESAELQDALEVAVGLQRAAWLETEERDAGIIQLHSPANAEVSPPPRWPIAALAASLAVAAFAGVLLWQSEAENARLSARIAELAQPPDSVLTVPLDVMRSAASGTPDVRIRKPAGAALLILDVEVAAQLLNVPMLALQVSRAPGAALLNMSAAPDADGRIQVALRADRLPDGILELRMSDPESGRADTRVIELLPALPLPTAKDS